jgi:hypothetical protein
LITFITPNISESPHANSAYVAGAGAVAGAVAGAAARDAEIRAFDLGRRHPGWIAFQRDPAFEQAVHDGRDGERLAHVLLHQQHRDARGEQLRQQPVDPPDNHGCEAKRELVEQ